MIHSTVIELYDSPQISNKNPINYKKYIKYRAIDYFIIKKISIRWELEILFTNSNLVQKLVVPILLS